MVRLRTRFPAHLIILALFALTATSGRAQEGPSSAVERAALGGLHRVAAVLDTTLELYRLALVELVPVARRIEALGQQKEASPATAVPPELTAVAGRLAASLSNRVPAAALPVIARGYHAEALEALVDLSTATRLDQTRPPLQAFARAIAGACDSAAAVVDLFSRKRPLLVRIIDPNTVLDDIGEALDQVGMAEREIVRLRKRRAALGDQLHAFLRLEISLGHALDLIASAEEAGIHIGFEIQRSTEEFNQQLERVRAHLAEVERIVTVMAAPPAAIPGRLQAVLSSAEAGGAKVDLSWTPPQQDPRPAAVRLYRDPNIDGLRTRVVAAYRCEGETAEEAETLARESASQLREQPERLVELPWGRSAHSDRLDAMPLAPPRYRVVAVSAYGVEQAGPQAAAIFVPPTLHGPGWVAAQSIAPPPSDDHFYYDFDAVHVRWGRSANDVAGAAARREAAISNGAPIVARYRVVRVEAEKATFTTNVSAGITAWVDRPGVEVLARGVRYTVEALSADGQASSPPQECRVSAEVVAKLGESLRLARAGLGAVTHPTAVEREVRSTMRDAAAVASRRDAFTALPEAKREQLVTAWWSSLPEVRRDAWLTTWPRRLGDEQRRQWLSTPPTWLSQRDVRVARVEVWLRTQPPEVQAEINRWWDLMTPAARSDALRAWEHQLGPDYRKWLSERLAVAAGQTRDQLERPARVLAWWSARDPREQEQLAIWWEEELDPAARRQGIATWYAGLDERGRLAVRWPAREQLSEAERGRRVDDALRDLPETVWPDFLAWLAWEAVLSAGGERLDAAVADEVGSLRGALVSLRYGLRPIDVAVSFQLPWVGPLSVLLLGALFEFIRRFAKRRRLPRE